MPHITLRHILRADYRDAQYTKDIEAEHEKTAYEELNGKFDYNKTSIVLVGIKALV